MGPNALHLHIEQHSCICGNKWQHCETWLASIEDGVRGGTPTPMQQHKLPYISYSTAESIYQVNGCMRCVPLQLGFNWTKPQPQPTPKPTTTNLAEDLLR